MYFVKHGKIPSADKMTLVLEDEGLSDEGIQEATEAAHFLKQRLKNDQSIHIVTSPRRRAVETARILARSLSGDSETIEIDKRLAERDCGSYSGQSIAEVFALPEEDLVAGGMESLASLYERSQYFYNDQLEKSVDVIIAVGHSGNVAPLYFTSKGKNLGDTLTIPVLSRSEALLLVDTRTTSE